MMISFFILNSREKRSENPQRDRCGSTHCSQRLLISLVEPRVSACHP